MNIKLNYLDNDISVSDEYIRILEIESKEYFYRVINDFNNIQNGNVLEDLYIYNSDLSEINLSNKLNLVIDYFNMDFNKKSNLLKLNKYIESRVLEKEKLLLSDLYKKIYKLFSNIVEEIELPIIIDDSYSVSDFIKLLEFKISNKNNLLDNLFLLIDVTKTFNLDKLLVFVNLKQYLSDEDLIEFYKYVIYHNCDVLLIENVLYKKLIEYEKKLIIDCDLVEYIV